MNELFNLKVIQGCGPKVLAEEGGIYSWFSSYQFQMPISAKMLSNKQSFTSAESFSSHWKILNNKNNEKAICVYF